MDLLNKNELKMLIRTGEGPCVSIYMPTHRMFPETKQDLIRFKNLLREAEVRLKAKGLRTPNAKRLLNPAKALVKDGLFWQYQADGLATFISSKVFFHYRLPLKFDELLVVSDRFYIKPLLSLFGSEESFYIMALSQNEVRFFQCTRYDIREIEIENLPRSLSEALRGENSQKQLQFHTRAPTLGGERVAMFHGHAVSKENAKDKILRYFHQINNGLRAVLNQERAPLVLAGVDYLFPIYREVNSYPYLLEQGIKGNPEGMRMEELHERGWKIVEPYFLSKQKEAMVKFRYLEGSKRASKNLSEIIQAAYEGKVDILFVAAGAQQWGVFDPKTRKVSLPHKSDPGDEDLVDLAAVFTVINGGTIYFVEPKEMPEETPLAAIFRY